MKQTVKHVHILPSRGRYCSSRALYEEEVVRDVCDAITHSVRHRDNMAMNGGMSMFKLLSMVTSNVSSVHLVNFDLFVTCCLRSLSEVLTEVSRDGDVEAADDIPAASSR